MSLLLFTDFLSFHLLDEMLKVFAHAIAEESAVSSNVSLIIAAATACVQEMLGRPECATSGSTRPLSAWLTITNPLLAPSKRDAAANLASSLETLLCHQLASKSFTCAQLYASILKYDPEKLIERVFAQRVSEGLDRDEHTCLIHQLVECDSTHFAPALAGRLFGKKVPKKIAALWSSGIFDSAVLSVVKRRGAVKEMGNKGQLLVNGLVHRTCVFVHAIVSLFTLLKKSNVHMFLLCSALTLNIYLVPDNFKE